MAPRANWKGYLKIEAVVCPVALYTAASTSERIAFHMVNRATGHRLHRRYIDGETGKVVEADDQVKGYEVGKDDYVILDPEEVAAAAPVADKTMEIEHFLAHDDVDDIYFDRPYYLAPSAPGGAQAFAVLRDGMAKKNTVAIARAVLFRRTRTLLIRPHGLGLIATTLNFDYEVRSPAEAFEGVPKMRIKGEMLDLAKHIITTKRGEFDPKKFDDRYESALAELVKAKLAGKPIEKRKAPPSAKVIDLMEALRDSAKAARGGAAKAKTSKSPAAAKGKKAPVVKKARPTKASARAKAAAPRRKVG